MTSIRDIAWVAGLLEGEGCFFVSNKTCLSSGTIAMVSTDLDTIQKFKGITGTTNFIQSARRNPKYWKTTYKVTISGNLAIQWMMTIYPLMSRRRQDCIKHLLSRWKSSPNKVTNNVSRIKLVRA